MGKTAALVRARERASRQVRERRARRSAAERDKRRAHDATHTRTMSSNNNNNSSSSTRTATTTATVHGATAVARSLPTRAEAAMLCAQFAQSCRLATPAADVCALLRHYAVIADDDEDGADNNNNNNDDDGDDNDSDDNNTTTVTDTHRKRARTSDADDDDDDHDAKKQRNTTTTTADTSSPPPHSANVTALRAFADALLRTADTPATADDDDDDDVAAAADDDNDEQHAVARDAATDDDTNNSNTQKQKRNARDDDDGDDVETQLHAILCDECGWRVVATLLRALTAAQMTVEAAAVSRCVLAAYEEEERLVTHHLACRVLRALVDYGDDATRTSVLLLLRQHSMTSTTTAAAVTTSAAATTTTADAQDDDDDDDNGEEVTRVRALLCDRHTAVTVTALLRSRVASATAAWLCDALGLTSTTTTSTTSTISTPDDDKVARVLLALIDHAVSCHVMRQLLQSSAVARAAVLRCLRSRLPTLLTSKRGVAFVVALLSTHELVSADDGNNNNKDKDKDNNDSDSSAAAAGVLDVVLSSLSSQLPALCVDARGNFVVQRLLLLATRTGATDAPAYITRILHAMTAQANDEQKRNNNNDNDNDADEKTKTQQRDAAAALRALAVHPLGVHVVLALVDAVLSLASSSSQQQRRHATRAAASSLQLLERVSAMLVTRTTVSTLLCDRYGSLVLRRLMPIIARDDTDKSNSNNKTATTTTASAATLLRSAIEQHMTTLMYDATGNMVVQAYLAHAGSAASAALARQLLKSSSNGSNGGNAHAALASACAHAAASHVVCALLEHADAATHTALCSALRSHAVALATHLHGRFIVAAALPRSRDVREVLQQHFVALATQKGTQHVLCALVAHADARSRAALVRDVASSSSQLRALATQQAGSIALQRLMQSSDEFACGVRDALARDARLRDELAQHFYGRYVVQLASSTTTKKASK